MKIFEPFSVIYRQRSILWSTTMNDIRLRYAGSVIGWLWLILYPLLLLTAYSFVYIFVFRSRMGDMTPVEYVMLIFSGLIPFLGFTEALSLCIPSVSSNSALIKNTLYPVDILPVKAVLVSQCTEVVGLCILFVALLVTRKLTFYILLLPVVWILQIMISTGLGWILSALNVFFKDLQNIVTLIVILLMMLSPIAYTVDMIPANLRIFQNFNIMYYLITCYQDILSVGRFPGWRLAALFGIALAVFYFGYWLFSRLKQVFSDYT